MTFFYGFPLLLGLATFLVLWRLLFSHLQGLERKLSVKIKETVLPDLLKTTTLLTTLSAAAVVLTVSALQVWSEQGVAEPMLMVLSWAGFTVSTLIGAFVLVGAYIYRFHYLAVIQHLETAEESANENNNDKKKRHLSDAKLLLDRALQLERTIFSLVVTQPLFFAVSVYYLFIFAMVNI